MFASWYSVQPPFGNGDFKKHTVWRHGTAFTHGLTEEPSQSSRVRAQLFKNQMSFIFIKVTPRKPVCVCSSSRRQANRGLYVIMALFYPTVTRWKFLCKLLLLCIMSRAVSYYKSTDLWFMCIVLRENPPFLRCTIPQRCHLALELWKN